jgi:hypothetical protein
MQMKRQDYTELESYCNLLSCLPISIVLAAADVLNCHQFRFVRHFMFPQTHARLIVSVFERHGLNQLFKSVNPLDAGALQTVLPSERRFLSASGDGWV